ncbi:MAG: glycoside hydrolase family 3 C-terminal domain-containing protein [Acidobacteriaceae bacterium]
MALVTLLLAGCIQMRGDAATPPAKPWMNKSLPPEKRAELLLNAMTLREKISMMHGVSPVPVQGYVGYVLPNPRLSIPALTEADGRAGVGNSATEVTVLPAPIAASSSWDIDLMHHFGVVLGNEEWGKGTNVALAPTMDVVRVPEWGRTFESYGEDPYLNSEMAVAEIRGIQSQGPIANANMYLVMNQETNRLTSNSIVDARTLHEIYLPPFEAAVTRGHVGTVMCAYVKTNGIYSCESPYLLKELLRKQLRFQGWVISDWEAAHSTAASLNAGLDQEMPSGYFYNELSIQEAMKNKQLMLATSDEHVRRILITMFRFGLFDKKQSGTWNSDVRTTEHRDFARQAAEEGSVLLKNEHHLLPLSKTSSIAVIGMAGGKEPKVGGGGSSGMVAAEVISPLDGIRKYVPESTEVAYAVGNNIAQAVEIARVAKVAIIFANTDETEGHDRPNLELPKGQDALIAAVAAVNPNSIVVLDTGGPVLMPWIRNVRGVIEAWYPGQENGNAIAAILYGEIDPSGKLPLTFPRSATEIPTATVEQWPGVKGESTYTEKLNVGYRWYDAKNVAPLFPFGFGLSYTTFRLSHFFVTPKSVEWESEKSNGNIRAELDVANTGERAGAEVVQVYVEQPAGNGEPPRQLRAFKKVKLAPGESKHVTLTLEKRSFAIYDPAAHAWKFPMGMYVIFAGTSSRDLPLRSEIYIRDGSVSH